MIADTYFEGLEETASCLVLRLFLREEALVKVLGLLEPVVVLEGSLAGEVVVAFRVHEVHLTLLFGEHSICFAGFVKS